MRLTTLAQLVSLCALAQAMSTSLMADIKEAHLQSPMKSNKVKRAQEFIMFGNQQNRASSSFGNPKSEKRATPLDDNSLNEEEEPVRTYSPAEDDRSMESNQLANSEAVDRSAYPHYLRDLYYSLLLRNMDVGQGLPRESAAYMDLPLYSMVEDRPKRDTNSKVQKSSSKTKPTSLTKEKPSQQSNKKGDRTKRDSLSDLVAMIKYIEAEKANKEYAEPRNYYKYSMDENTPRDDINDLVGGSPNWNEDDAMSWYDLIQAPPGPKNGGAYYLPHPRKRFMVSKRRYDDSPLYGQDPYYNYLDGIQARRRYLI